ncbi:hypothetical protein KUTeg_005285 [Tegillarca granosa]|uniref:Uncharacterized protein n=1 Tax=Tegillarca granosa TaxID=220873 RepID=A0ABQ9FMI1_TEGGR|nr:hypothetical protein KUTeg_005285 [Tegillarca granosa]
MLIYNLFEVVLYLYTMSISIFYMFGSMAAIPPWQTCGYQLAVNESGYQAFNETCYIVTNQLQRCSVKPFGSTCLPSSSVPNDLSTYQHYSENIAAEHTDYSDIGHLGSIRWKLALCCLVGVIVVFLTLIKGVRSLGKVACVSVLVVSVSLLVFLVRGLTLEGHSDGLRYISPSFEQLQYIHMWLSGVTLALYNIGVGLDVIILVILQVVIGLLTTTVILCFLGYYMQKFLDRWMDISNHSGPSLMYFTFPTIFAVLPAGRFWSIMFYVMLIFMHIIPIAVRVETIKTATFDLLENVRKYSANGLALMKEVDVSMANVMTLLSLLQMYILGYIYVTPILLQVVVFVNMVDFYSESNLPILIILTLMLPIPLFVVIKFAFAKGSVIDRWHKIFSPTKEFGPRNIAHREAVQHYRVNFVTTPWISERRNGSEELQAIG